VPKCNLPFITTKIYSKIMTEKITVQIFPLNPFSGANGFLSTLFFRRDLKEYLKST